MTKQMKLFIMEMLRILHQKYLKDVDRMYIVHKQRINADTADQKEVLFVFFLITKFLEKYIPEKICEYRKWKWNLII